MTTKTEQAAVKLVNEYTYSRSDRNGSYTSSPSRPVQFGSNSITYADGGRLPSGHWPWKECVHDESGLQSAVYANVAWSYGYSVGTPRWVTEDGSYNFIAELSNVPLPAGSFDRQAIENVLSQLDLNSTENVLLYSGVLQAVPLVGSVLKLTSILNNAARKFAKNIRRKPFTTAVKTLISADFVDRFVISPMLDDARRFQDATDYVLRVIDTARERSTHRFALQGEVTTKPMDTVITGWESVNGYSGSVNYRDIKTQMLTSKAFMLLEASYDMMAVDPLKVWAQRVGLTRPLDSVWDLVPFSFVIDYFTRAGDFIAALSDEMSNVDGLKGRIVRIHDMWYTFLKKGEYRRECTGLRSPPNFSGGQWLEPPRCTKGAARRVNSHFERKRISDPWSVILSFGEKRIDDYLSINTNLSSTRKRTIAELVIQSKL